MARLSKIQSQVLDRLLDIATSSGDFPPNVLLVGPSGAGKRTVARAAATEFGMAFTEIPVDDSARYVRERLVGGSQLRGPQNGGRPPGEFGQLMPTVVYLSGLEALDEEICQVLHQMLSSRRYADLSGREWTFSRDLWVIGAMTWPSKRHAITPEHWLRTAFDRRVDVLPPRSEDDLIEACECILGCLGGANELDADIGTVLKLVPLANDNLRSLGRWLEHASVRRGQGDAIRAVDLQGAMLSDLDYLMARVVYRGQPMSPSRLESWCDQFPERLRPLTLHIFKKIAERYYVGEGVFYKHLDYLVKASGIPPKSAVTFCRWQQLGRSGPDIAHRLKNQAWWQPTAELDLRRGAPTRPDFDHGAPRWFLVADDFVGSGKAMSRVISASNTNLVQLLEEYTEAELCILVIAAFESGLARVREALGKLRHRTRIVVADRLADEDRCFHEKSLVLPDDGQRKQMRDCCWEVARRHFSGLDRRHRLGWDGISGLTVFSDTVPNAALPILWYTASKWSPLFPASGLPEDI